MNSHPRRYDAILFDFDGVLADTERLHWKCWRTLLEPCGIPLEWSDYRRSCVGVANRIMLEKLALRAPQPVVDIRELLALNPRKREMFQQVTASLPVINAGTVSCILAISDYKKAVVSSSSGYEVRSALLSAGILDSFGVVVCGEDVSVHKLGPEPYRYAAALLSVHRPPVVEDTEIGVRSGREAGFDVLLIFLPQRLGFELNERLRLGERTSSISSANSSEDNGGKLGRDQSTPIRSAIERIQPCTQRARTRTPPT